jgi:hypothetical protein
VAVEPTCDDGARNGDESDTDCGGSCPACDDGSACGVPGDCASNRCESGSCFSCSDLIRNGAEIAIDCGGPCPGCPDGTVCTLPVDCASGRCEVGTNEDDLCASCADHRQTGTETDIDCGGTCDGCADGRSCAEPADCLSGICAGGLCVSCSDGHRSGDETDADCGGSCPGCDDGSACVVPDDCASTICDGGVCTSCSDDAVNGTETDIDCGGPVCERRCDVGDACDTGEDCLSLVCEGGLCVGADCDDSLLNGSETGLDCGGDGGCDRCSPDREDQGCVESTDCVESAYCDAGSCEWARSCLDLLERRPSTATGPYTISPGVASGPGQCEVFCDMTTDGGGWTLVASSLGEPLDDRAAACHADLASVRPTAANPGVWSGLRDLTDAGLAHEADIRFSCKRDAADFSFEVDLVFSEVDWYYEVTRGTDTHACFAPELDGAGAPLDSPAPVRRLDVLSGTARAAADPWIADTFHGEHACVDPDTFAVDLDGPGVSAPGALGLTSWGEVDGEPRCGPAALEPGQGAWFVWFRELPAAP